jgi:hypothetical protein
MLWIELEVELENLYHLPNITDWLEGFIADLKLIFMKRIDLQVA